MSNIISVPNREPNYLTPCLPAEAIMLAKDWQTNRNMPAFVLAFDQLPGACQYCGGVGKIYLRLCDKGPYFTPQGTKTPYTYFQGDHMFRKGWYSIADTFVYDCKECSGAKQ